MKLSNHSGLGRTYEDVDEGAYVSGSGSHGAVFEDGGSYRSGLYPFIYRVVRGVDYSNILAEFN